jgi:tail assembly chaperone
MSDREQVIEGRLFVSRPMIVRDMLFCAPKLAKWFGPDLVELLSLGGKLGKADIGRIAPMVLNIFERLDSDELWPVLTKLMKCVYEKIGAQEQEMVAGDIPMFDQLFASNIAMVYQVAWLSVRTNLVNFLPASAMTAGAMAKAQGLDASQAPMTGPG